MCNLQVFKHNILVQKMTNVYSTLKCVQQNTNVAQQDEVCSNVIAENNKFLRTLIKDYLFDCIGITSMHVYWEFSLTVGLLSQCKSHI